ncbi:hypothetical protein [Bartonella bovis]|uniref:hypothetical protein n=1 Tax=Bartonella bovis TaxID=155194 RepID=UPI0003A3153F|nr:hypothetical protein [Bartonella bovis]
MGGDVDGWGEDFTSWEGVEVMGSGRLVMMGGEIGFKGEHGVTMSGGQALFYGVSITGSGDKSTGVGWSWMGRC